MADVELKSVSKKFGNTEVLHSVDLRVEDQEFVVFVGPSGCGKTTLLRLIAGLEDVTEGQISIDGNRVEELRPSKHEERPPEMFPTTFLLFGSPGRTRTSDMVVNSHPLYQLSYRGI